MFDPPPGAILALIPLYAAADRLWGADKPAFKGKKALIAIALAGVGFLLAGWLYAVVGLIWVAYRSLPFKGGAAAPTNSKERTAAILRHLAVVPIPVFATLGTGRPLLMASLLSLYAVAATAMAFWYGGKLIEARRAGRPIGEENIALEIARGAAFGAALAVYVLAHPAP